MGRSPCCSDDSIKKGPWSPEEDERLIEYVQKNGPGNWQTLPKKAGLRRCGKSCRLRWTNYLRPDIKRGPFSEKEEAIIINLHQELGNKWSRIAAYLPGRTDNEIKNHWNTHMKKKLLKSGIDPNTHQQISDLNLLSQMLSNTNLSNLITFLSPAPSIQCNATEMLNNLQCLQQLQNMLPTINSSSLPYLQAISPLNGLINGAHSQHIGGNFFQPQNVLASLSNLTPLLNEHLLSISNSLQCCEGDLSPQGVPVNNNIGLTDISTLEYSLPSLVSGTPESSIVNPLERTKNSCIPKQALESDIFDTWDKFLDDEASSSFLKDIMG